MAVVVVGDLDAFSDLPPTPLPDPSETLSLPSSCLAYARATTATKLFVAAEASGHNDLPPIIEPTPTEISLLADSQEPLRELPSKGARFVASRVQQVSAFNK